MANLSKVVLDARSDPATVQPLAAGTELQLRHATQVSAANAAAWRRLRPDGGQLTALVDVTDAARLDVANWAAALVPDRVELRTPAWSEAGMAAIGWPAGHAQLVRVLAALAAAGVQARLALHVSALTLTELHGEALDALALQAGLDALQVVLWPVLGPQTPPLAEFARMAAALTQTAHLVVATKLFPACGLPLGLDAEATFASERTAARQAFLDACAGCPAREEGRCDGMAADLLRATTAAGIAWQGWSTLAADREPVVVVAEPSDRLEQIAMRLGLRRVWRSELPLADAEALGAHPPAGLHVVHGPRTTLDPESRLEFEVAHSTWQIQYLALDLADAEAARDAELAAIDADIAAGEDAHRRLAQLFGYPTCCVDAFLAAVRARQQPQWRGVAENAFAALQAARSSQLLDRRLDFAIPTDDGCTVRHTPCRYDCGESLQMVAAIEAELGRIAPGRLAAKRALWADAALIFADSAQIPLLGTRSADGGLGALTVVTDWRSSGPRAVIAQRALNAVAAQLASAVALRATYPLSGPGGVTLRLADGSEQPLESPGVPQHPEFPRLLVFAAR